MANTSSINSYSPFEWILVGKPELLSFSNKKRKTTRRLTKPETRAIFLFLPNLSKTNNVASVFSLFNIKV